MFTCKWVCLHICFCLLVEKRYCNLFLIDLIQIVALKQVDINFFVHIDAAKMEDDCKETYFDSEAHQKWQKSNWNRHLQLKCASKLRSDEDLYKWLCLYEIYTANKYVNIIIVLAIVIRTFYWRISEIFLLFFKIKNTLILNLVFFILNNILKLLLQICSLIRIFLSSTKSVNVANGL